ncbi:hypothetical protein HMPREF1565_3728 [Providencia alcalifaciens RIMD 1656011]|nr:hypothetical protein HMPREF1565_3728 [Providencia alcalifaciens RIMD 1656011]
MLRELVGEITEFIADKAKLITLPAKQYRKTVTFLKLKEIH